MSFKQMVQPSPSKGWPHAHVCKLVRAGPKPTTEQVCEDSFEQRDLWWCVLPLTQTSQKDFLFGAETTVDCNLIFWKILLLGGILTLFPNVFDLAHVPQGCGLQLVLSS